MAAQASQRRSIIHNRMQGEDRIPLPVLAYEETEMKALKAWAKKLGARRIIWLCGMLLSLLVAAAAVVMLLNGGSDSDMEEYTLLAQEAHSSSHSFVDFDMLTAENEDTAAWLLCEGTGIDYPVVRSEDSGKYIDHSFSGDRSRLGCLYMDSACAADLSGRSTVIYGGELLAPLYNYSSQDYYDLLPYVTLYTPQGKHIVALIAGAYTEDMTSMVRTEFASDGDFAAYISGLRSGSCFVSSVSTDADTRLVTLCAEDSGGAFVLVGVVQ